MTACPDCGKIRYLTKADAKAAIRQMQGRHGRLNAYRCPSYPGLWHIGHLPDGVRKGIYGRDDITRRSA